MVSLAARFGQLLPLTSMTNRPGKPDEVILFYGQSHAIVRYLIESYGPEKMAELLRTLKSGRGEDDALMQVYGLDRAGLDARWRSTLSP